MQNELDFSGRSALITGAASGIGAATARWLDAHGIARLVLVDLDRSGLDALGLRCQALPVVGDVSDSDLWAKVLRDVGQIDHAVLNAAIAPGGSAIVESDFAEWKKAMAINLDGTYLGLRAAMSAMRGRGGSIVVTASIAAHKSIPGTAAYSTSKAAVIQLARIAAAEGAADNIRVNSIAPGAVDTPIWDKTNISGKHPEGHKEIIASLETRIPRGQVASADEIASQIGFLLSPMAANITGAVLVSDGGTSL